MHDRSSPASAAEPVCLAPNGGPCLWLRAASAWRVLACSVIALVGMGPGGLDAAQTDASLVERGRYLTVIGGCNDCHTAGFAQSGGKIDDAQRLLGDVVGFAGPWGTTYASNLRLKIGAMDLPTFRSYARNLLTRPPMPYWALNAMSDRDVEALWHYVRSLPPAGSHAPAALPPGAEAAGPVVRFPSPPADAAPR